MKKVAFITVLTAIFAFSAVAPVFAAVIDAYNSPAGNILISNYTRNPGSSSAWSSSVSANAGEVVSVGIYYSNAGPDTARNVVVRLTPAQLGSNSTYTFTGTITSDNAPTVTGTVTLNLTSAQTLAWLNQVYWAQNSQTSSSAVSSPNDLFGSGLHLGDVAVNNGPNQGYGTVVARFQVGNNSGGSTSDPAVTTNSATNVQMTSATLNGQVDPHGASNVNYWFEWGTSPTFGNTSGNGTVSGISVYNPSFTLSNLNSNISYWYRLVAQRPGGAVVYGATQSFTTQYQGGGSTYDPLANTQSVSNVGYNYATLNGNVDARGYSGVQYWFEYGTNGSYGYTTGTQSLGSSGYQNVSAYVSNLSNNTTYYYRLAAQRPGGPVSYGSQYTFTTSYNNGGYSNNTPTVTTNSAQTVGNANSMVLNGYLGSAGNGYSYANTWFEWGSDTAMSNRTSSQSTSVGSFSSTVGNLINGQTYYFRAVAQNAYGTVYGNMLSFNTNGNGTCYGSNCNSGNLYARTDLATSIYSTSAVLNGYASVNNSTYSQNLNGWFEWGTTMSLGSQTPVTSIGYVSNSNFSRTLSGLSSASTYYYRAVVQDQNGNIARGDIYRVTTAAGSTSTNTVTYTTDTTKTSSPIALSYGTDKMRPYSGDLVTYRIGWRNETGSRLANAALKIELPSGVTYIDSDSAIARDGQTLMYAIGNVYANSGDVIYFRAVIDRGVGANTELPVRVTMNFQNNGTGQRGVVQIVGTTNTADNQGTTYTNTPASSAPVTADANSNSALAGIGSAFAGTFFPQTAVGWLLFVLLLVLLGIMVRKYIMKAPTA